MSIPVFSAPVLSYVGSVDTTSADDPNNNFGTNQFIVEVEPSLNILGNLLLFEYKLQDAGTATDPSNVTLGYISMDAGTSFQLGQGSQYQIGIPAESNNLNTTSREVQIRAYSGLLGTTDIVVTPWSNALEVHNPPTQPLIDVAFYNVDAVGGNDDLYVFFNPIENPFIDWDVTQIVVAYYYLDPSGETIWQVSEPLFAVDISYGLQLLKMVTVASFGKVSTTTPVIYTSAYAVFSFADLAGDYYYSVSRISSTVNALAASSYDAPDITDISYNVYSDPAAVYPGNQDMTISWNPPLNTVLPNFNVDYYILEYTTDVSGGDWTVIANDISANTLSYIFNPWVDAEIGCGNTVSYRIRAILTDGTSTPYSNILGESIFTYATAPQNLSISSSSFDGGLVSFTVNFDAPNPIGCGSAYQYVITVIDNSGNIYTQNVPVTGSSYSIPLVDLSLNQIGVVEVYLQTQDTNAPFDYLNGQVASAGYVGVDISQSPISYQIYTNGLQIMDLSWSIGVLPDGWSLSNYSVYLSVNDGSFNLIQTTPNSFYAYTVTEPCGDNLAFQIEVTATYGSVDYNLISNIENLNVFKYSGAPASTIIDWALITEAETEIDLYVHWTNPTNTGCGVPQNFVITIPDPLDPSVNLYSTEIAYNSLATVYDLLINNVPYVASGTLVIGLKTQDTNNSFNYLLGATSETSFVSQNLPFISNIVFNSGNTSVTFTVDTAGYLVYINGFINVVGGVPVGEPVYSSGSHANQTVSYQVLENGVSRYTFTVQAAIFDGGFGDAVVFAFSNAVGVSTKPYPVPPI